MELSLPTPALQICILGHPLPGALALGEDLAVWHVVGSLRFEPRGFVIPSSLLACLLGVGMGALEQLLNLPELRFLCL